MIMIKKLSKTYVSGFPSRRRTNAVNGIDLSVEKGEVFGLLGPNGAGKTSIVKMICGLVRPSSGDIFLDGHRLTPHSRWPSRLVGALLEGSRNVYWNLTCQENLLYFARLRGIRGKVARVRTAELLAEFDLTPKRKDAAGTLSRGMQQKLALCCALISSPKILLVDEPTLGLDVSSARAIRVKLRRLIENEDRTVLLTTHDMRLAASACDRVGIIDRGLLIRIGGVDDLVGLLGSVIHIVECCGLLSAQAQEELVGITGVSLDGCDDRWTIRLAGDSTDRLADGLYEVISILRDAGASLASVREEKPTLEDVFVQLTEEVSHAKRG